MTRDIKIVAFDIDGTLTEGYSWDSFHESVGISQDVSREWYNELLQGVVSASAHKNRVMKYYRASGKTRQDFERVGLRFRFKKGARRVIRALKDKYTLHLVSDAPSPLIAMVAKALGISHTYTSNVFVFRESGEFLTVRRKFPVGIGKRQYLEAVSETCCISSKQIVFVGDSYNDIEAFRYTERGIMVGNGPEELATVAWRCVPHLEALIPMFA